MYSDVIGIQFDKRLSEIGRKKGLETGEFDYAKAYSYFKYLYIIFFTYLDAMCTYLLAMS